MNFSGRTEMELNWDALNEWRDRELGNSTPDYSPSTPDDNPGGKPDEPDHSPEDEPDDDSNDKAEDGENEKILTTYRLWAENNEEAKMIEVVGDRVYLVHDYEIIKIKEDAKEYFERARKIFIEEDYVVSTQEEILQIEKDFNKMIEEMKSVDPEYYDPDYQADKKEKEEDEEE